MLLLGVVSQRAKPPLFRLSAEPLPLSRFTEAFDHSPAMILDSCTSEMKADVLLSEPKESEDAPARKAERQEVSYESLSGKYKLWGNKDVTRQYFKMYSARLEKMRPVVEAKAKDKWGECR